MTLRRTGRIVLALLLALVGLLGAATCALPRPGLPRGAPPPAAGAADATVVVSRRYRAGPLRRALLGRGYRELWATPVRLPVLDMDAYTPVRRGGGGQTRSLHLDGPGGRDYAFRSVDKDQSQRLNGVLRAVAGPARQDQVSAMHPAAAVVADALQRSAGILTAPPRLVVMPDAPALDSFRVAFTGLPGTLEERPDAGFAGAGAVVDSDELAAELARRGEAVDTAAYLAMRLMDVYLGDWDRHDGQVRWARMWRGGRVRWVPIPRDRDYAFADYRGVIPAMARAVDPKVVRFDREYRDLRGLLVKARARDRGLLCGLNSAAWDSTAAALRDSLTDGAIAAAVGRMPREWAARSGSLSAILRARRDHLPDAARRARAHVQAACPR